MEKIKEFKRLINDLSLDGYLIPKNDEFFSEYTPFNKDNLKFITNFSGSCGFAIILKKENFLFVDGRYTLQAKKESGKLFKIFTMPEKCPSDVLKNRKLTIGFDPKIHTEKMLVYLFKKTNCKLVAVKDNLVKKIRPNFIEKRTRKFFSLNTNVVGMTYKIKIKKVSSILKKAKINIQFITAPENVAWLLNIRGGDSSYSPVPNSYVLLDGNKINFFCDSNKLDKKIRIFLKNINIVDINKTVAFLKQIKNKKIQIDINSCSLEFKNLLKKNNTMLETIDPIYFLKSIKNKVEIKNNIKSHIYDGAALTRFLIWVKKNYEKKNVTEISAQEKLLEFRKKNRTFKNLSFPTISGTGPNGAIIHYKADKKNNRKLKKGDLYLIDSGGQYNFGTTDVTRTISLKNNNKRIRNIFTRVLKGHIAVSNYKIKTNTTGSKIDLIARKALKEIDLDYPHGTGHGVGYFLNVHEGPCGISRGNKTKFLEGMVISNEPGYYENNRFGIRIENLIMVKKKNKATFFEELTLVPIDKTLIEKDLLNLNEIRWLNNYHLKVFTSLKKFMSKDELPELKNYCSNI